MSHGNTARQKIVVGFTVHEAKELNKDGVAIDALCIVRAAGREFRTDIKRGKIQHAKFEEGHIWNDLYLTEDDFNMSFIDFELQAACAFTRNEVIGSARVQLAMVRKRANHTIAGKWIQLTSAHESTARVRATIFCYGEGDAPPGAQEKTNDEDEAAAHHEDLRNAVLDQVGPKQVPSAAGQSYHLFVQVHRAEDLGGGDKLYNPFVTVEFNGHRLASQHVLDANKLNFEEQFRLPVQTPLLADAIVIRVWSKNKWGADDIIVQGRLSFSLIRMHAMPPQWFTFYGFLSKEVPDVEQICSHGEVVEENAYLGRLLISSHVTKVKHGGLLKAAAIQGGAFEEPAAAQLTLMAEVYEVSGVEGSQAYVSMSLGKQSKKTKTIEREDDETSFNFAKEEAGRMPLLVGVVPVDPKNQTDVILSLHVKGSFSMLGMTEDGFQRIGFVRLKLSDIRDWQGDTHIPKWVALRPMVHLPSSVKPGAVLLCLSKTSQVAVKDRVKPAIKRLPFELRCYICMARGLATQSQEMPKAFCEVSCAGQVARTQTADDPPTSAPRWAECLTMPVELQYSVQNSRVYPEPIQLVVYDDVVGGTMFDKLNKAVETAKEAAESDDVAQTLTKHGENVLNGLENQEEFGTKMKRGVQELFGAIQDTVGAMGGDVMAKKRVGEVVNGRRVIGRANIHYNHIVKPPGGRGGLAPTWVKLKGGMMGSNHAGDILVGFEMLKPKYASTVSCNDAIVAKEAAPQGGRKCVLSVAVAGLRGVKVPEGYGALEKPRLEIAVSSFEQAQARKSQVVLDEAEVNERGEAVAVVEAKADAREKPKGRGNSKEPSKAEAQAGREKIRFFRKPTEGLEVSKDDYNRKWTVNGVSGFEFLRVIHLPVMLPNEAVWEPDVTIRLLDEKDRLMAEGRMSLADRLPWDNTPAKRLRANRSVQAQDDWPPGPEQEDDGGIPVSDDEDDANYKLVEHGNEPCQLRFNDADSKTFPPMVESLAKSSAARRAGVKAGDWLVGYSKPGEKEKPTGHWTQAQAAAFIQSMDEQRVRPLTLRFRRKGREEVSVRLTDGKTMLDFEDDETVRPPKIDRDKTADGWWTKQGVLKGWRVVDVNGFDCRAWHGKHDFFQKLLQMRPIIVTCRSAQPRNAAAERELQLRAKVMLNGVPSVYLKAFEHRLKSSDSCLDGTLVPRCSALIPPVSDAKLMNLWPAQDGCLDVRGKPVPIATGSAEDADERARPSVEGLLEDSMERPEFETVRLWNGRLEVGLVKLAYTVKNPLPFSLDWTSHPKFANDPERELFDEKKLRKRFKVGQPAKVRVRTYITRGLSVSGAVQGVGNPFLYFSYGNDTVKLEGRRKLNTSEPRFFTTEERDIQLPDQALFEVGLYDWQEYGEPQLIGKTVIDLEDRWFTPGYQDYVKKQQVPIEYRPLLSGDQGSLCKGSLEMWVELLDSQDAAEVRKSPLFQPPPVEVEMRIVVWAVRNMSLRLCVDEFGDERGRADVLARCQLSCPAYLGPQPADQETDIHYGSEGEAEFNWRFVYSRIAITKGVPLMCHIQLSLWEHFALKRPILLCENLMDMKNYCTRVARTRDMLEIESEVPLSNRLLTKMLQDEAEYSKWEALDNAAPNDSSSEEEAEELKPHGQAERSVGADAEIPVAALVKILVQVVPQTEASEENRKVGMKRDNPNRNPVLAYPKTGRNWQYALPTAVNVIEGIIDTVNTTKRRMCYMSVIVAFVLVVAMLHYVKDSRTGCPFIMSSCKSTATCAACACCHHKNEKAGKFCYYSFLGSGKCVSEPYLSACNIAGGKCELAGACMDWSAGLGGSCQREPQGAVATVTQTGGR